MWPPEALYHHIAIAKNSFTSEGQSDW